jgi:hypothetical protein
MAKYITEPRNITETGLTLLQINPDRAADLQEGSQFYGWLFWHHPDGQWVSERKLTPRELTDAFDQASDMRVLDAFDPSNILRSKSGVRFA